MFFSPSRPEEPKIYPRHGAQGSGSGRASGMVVASACSKKQLTTIYREHGDNAQTDVILDPIKLHVKLENGGGFRDTLKVVHPEAWALTVGWKNQTKASPPHFWSSTRLENSDDQIFDGNMLFTYGDAPREPGSAQLIPWRRLNLPRQWLLRVPWPWGSSASPIACAEWPISTVLKVIIAYAAHVMIMPCYIIHRKSLYNILIDIT